MEKRRTCGNFRSNKKVYTAQSAFFDGLKESQLEERFYTIIFKKILPFYEVQESSGPDSPDYAFFAAQESIDNAHISEDSKSFFSGAPLPSAKSSDGISSCTASAKIGRISEETPAFRCGCI